MPSSSVEELQDLLMDKRPWSQKARIVGLQDEYQFSYEYTSSLLHCIGYSLFTEPEIQYAEEFIIRGLANKYSSRALEELHRYSKVPRMKVVFVEDEKPKEQNS